MKAETEGTNGEVPKTKQRRAVEAKVKEQGDQLQRVREQSRGKNDPN